MLQSLRRQKILFERELRRLVHEGEYMRDNIGNYRLREPFPPDYFTARDLRIRERKRKKGFDRKIEQNIDALTKYSGIPKNCEPLVMKEFDDDFPDWKLD